SRAPPIFLRSPSPTLFRSRQKYFHPPVKVHFFDENGKLTWPYVYNYRLVDVGRRIYEPITDTTYPVKLFVRTSDTYKLFGIFERSEEHTSELQSREKRVCR